MGSLAAGNARATQPLTVVKHFHDRAAQAAQPVEIEAEAALRQFSRERLVSYGVDDADAGELRARVEGGERWMVAAQALARTCLSPPEGAAAPASPRTLANRQYRASALYRMSQMMFLADNGERRDILAEAVRLYAGASTVSGDRQPVAIEAAGGTLAGWLHPAAVVHAVGAAIVIGGVEGWAMDFGPLGTALAARGVHALLLDGPGQGETRLAHGHYLTVDWVDAYRCSIDFLEQRFADLPIGFVGNSMGGSLATVVAATDKRIRACVNNGGPMYPTRAVANASFFKKMITHCGDVSPEEAVRVWATTEPLSCPQAVACPYLIIHGGRDPLVTDEEAALAFARATAPDKTIITFSDGIHCVYNHENDKQDLIADWLASRLAAG